MFIYTAKFSKKKAVIFLLLLAVVLCLIIVLAGHHDMEKSADDAFSQAAETNERRVEYLNSFGWEVSDEPVEEQQIVIPKEFSSVYDEYNEIQKKQGFDLADYAGLDAVRYTYEVRNYPDYSGRVCANLILYKGRVIAGDIQATALDGFIHGLEMP